MQSNKSAEQEGDLPLNRHRRAAADDAGGKVLNRHRRRAAEKIGEDAVREGKERQFCRPISLTVQEAARIGGLGVSTLWKYIALGHLDSVSIGRRRLILFDSLERLLSGDKAA